MQEDSSSFDYPSLSQRFESRMLSLSERPEPPTHLHELIRTALRLYDDVDDDDFVLLSSHEDLPQPAPLTTSYMLNNHRTLVPIGANFQVVIPPMLTEATYRAKTADSLRTLKILKVNDPEEGEQFYGQHFDFIEEKLGPGRSYEDVNMLRNAFRRLHSRLKFEEYLTKNLKHWENYFRQKERSLAPRLPVKKKKKKGTIPV